MTIPFGLTNLSAKIVFFFQITDIMKDNLKNSIKKRAQLKKYFYLCDGFYNRLLIRNREILLTMPTGYYSSYNMKTTFFFNPNKL